MIVLIGLRSLDLGKILGDVIFDLKIKFYYIKNYYNKYF